MNFFKKIKYFEGKNKGKIKKISRSLWGLIAIMAAWYCFFGYQYQFIYCYGDSMLPNYYHGEWMIVEPVKRASDLRRFDVVVLNQDGEKLTKRILALEGETVKIKNGYFYVNDKKFEEPYGKGNFIYWTEPEDVRENKPKEEWLFLNIDEDVGLVPKGFVFVAGDNRNITWYGIVSVKEIKSVVVL